MDSHLMLARKNSSGGYTWTLASRLGEMLREIENLYGPRNREYTLLGIEFEESGPRIWYPGNCKNIIIQLSLSSQFSLPCALFELSHEAVHLLSPSGGRDANYLEEGLATFYSWHYVKKILSLDCRHYSSSNYEKAGLLVERLLSFNPGFFLEARKVESEIWKMSAKLLKSFVPELAEDDCKVLARAFYVPSNSESYAPGIV